MVPVASQDENDPAGGPSMISDEVIMRNSFPNNDNHAYYPWAKLFSVWCSHPSEKADVGSFRKTSYFRAAKRDYYPRRAHLVEPDT